MSSRLSSLPRTALLPESQVLGALLWSLLQTFKVSIPACTFQCMHRDIQTYVYVYTYIHLHTYIYTYMYMYIHGRGNTQSKPKQELHRRSQWGGRCWRTLPMPSLRASCSTSARKSLRSRSKRSGRLVLGPAHACFCLYHRYDGQLIRFLLLVLLFLIVVVIKPYIPQTLPGANLVSLVLVQ